MELSPEKVGSTGTLCESPSLPHGSIHVVVATYKYKEMEAEIGFDYNNYVYLWDLGLSNAEIYWYRRQQSEAPLRQVDGPCGMRLNERLLLPNYGRDGAAFFDHVLEFYDDPPLTIIFLHGHAAIGWHSSCDSVFARTAYVYRDLVSSNHQHGSNKTVQNHMMTLTSPDDGTRGFVLNDWSGGGTQQRRLGSHTHNGTDAKTPCKVFKERWHEQVFSRLPKPQYSSCCASFILSGYRIRRYPRVFYEELQALLTNEAYPDQGRECFEFLVYSLFGEEANTFTDQELQSFYDKADGLVHGEADQVVVRRMQRCKATRQLGIRKRKWRNTFKRFGMD